MVKPTHKKKDKKKKPKEQKIVILSEEEVLELIKTCNELNAQKSKLVEIS